MADGTSVLSTVQSLRAKLSADPPPPPPRILRTLQKLAALPISIDVLHETGIGKVVNGFRKYEGDIAESARSLVRRWKAMVREAMDKEATRQETLEMQSQEEAPHQTALAGKDSPRPQARMSSKTENPGTLKNRPKSQAVINTKNIPKPHSPARPESSTKSPPSKSSNISSSHQPSKLSSSRPQSSREPKQCRADGLPEEAYTLLKEKQPSGSGTPLKKAQTHLSPGGGKARISSESKVTKDTHEPPGGSRDELHHRPHDKAPSGGVKKAPEHKLSSQSGQSRASQEPQHNSTNGQGGDARGKISRDKPVAKRAYVEAESVPVPKKKAVAPDPSALNGTVDSSKPAVTKTSKKPASSPAHASAQEKAAKQRTPSEQDSFKRPPTKPSPVGKNPPGDYPAADIKDEDEDIADAKSYDNTGMSFGDCLLGPMVKKVKKVVKTRSPQNLLPKNKSSSLGSSPSKSSRKGNAASAPQRSSDSRTKVEGRKSDPGTPKVKVDSSRTTGGGKSGVSADRTKPSAGRGEHSSDGQSSDPGQGSDAGQGSDGGRRQRKKRSMSEEEEQAIKNAKKLRRESSSEVSLALPEIQPNYKPMRLPEIASPLKKRALTPEEEMAYLGSKQGRTKVFSGRVRVNRLSSVPRLYDMCMDILCDNIDALDEVGGVPYDILHPVLQRCTPQQLFHLEDCNPHLLEDSDPLWQKHAEKDFRSRHPTEMESWRELYIREHDAREARFKSITASITKQMAAKDPGRLTKMAFLDRPAKPPRNVVRQQLRHGTASGNFMPEKRSHSSTQPNRSSKVVIDSCGADVSGFQHRQAKPAKVVAPMMMKTLKMIKKLRR